MCTDGANVQNIHTVQGAKRGALVETSAMPLLLQGLRGGGRRKYAGSISWAHGVCFKDLGKYCFWVWNFCRWIQMFRSLLVCLTLSHLESITRLRRLVLRIHPSAGSCKYLAKWPNIVKSLKSTSCATAACVSKSSKYMFPNYITKAVIPYVGKKLFFASFEFIK